MAFTYGTFYWSTIIIELNNNFTGSANLYNVFGNVVGKLLLKTSADFSTGELALVEDFSFLFNNGTMNFTIGFNQYRFDNIRNGNYGLVANKSGVYTDIDHIRYYFEYENESNLWKITFRYEP
jgi:hypothetical protein